MMNGAYYPVSPAIIYIIHTDPHRERDINLKVPPRLHQLFCASNKLIWLRVLGERGEGEQRVAAGRVLGERGMGRRAESLQLGECLERKRGRRVESCS